MFRQLFVAVAATAVFAQCALAGQSAVLVERRAAHRARPTFVGAFDTLPSSGLVVTGGDDGFVRVWDGATLEPLREIRATRGVPQGVAMLDGGATLVAAYGDGEGPTDFVAEDVWSGRRRALFTSETAGAPARCGANFVYTDGAAAVLASAEIGATIRTFAVDDAAVKLAVSGDARRLAVADDSGAVALFDVGSGERLGSWRLPDADVTGLAISPDGATVYATTYMRRVYAWDAATGVARDLAGTDGQARSIGISADGRFLAVGTSLRAAVVIDAASGETVARLDVHDAVRYVTGIALDGPRLLFVTDTGAMLGATLDPRED
jgi:WD40 repeat protein